jgi:2-keto-4-pentenoate hydratase
MTISPTAAAQAASLLWTHWQAGSRLEALAPDCRPASRADGYRIQAAVRNASGRSQFGWKIAATSAAGQAHIGVDGPLAGRLLCGQIDADGDCIALGTTQMHVAEVEFAFRMARSLEPRADAYEVHEVLDAVATLHPAIEIPDSRYADFVTAGAPQLIADNACAHRFILGVAAHCNWRAINLRDHLVDCVVTGRAPMQGKGENVLGDPRIALTWLANELRANAMVLEAGQVVTTGTCLVPVQIGVGDELRADFGPIGQISVRFCA